MKNNSSAFVHQLLVCLLVTIGFGGSIGLGTVWMRHRISTTANTNRTLKAECDRIERLIDEKKTIIETEASPARLRSLNSGFQLGLVQMNEVQLLHVTENPTDRLAARAARASRELFTDRAAPPSAPITFPKIAQR